LIGAEFLLVGLAEACHFGAEARRTEAEPSGNKNPSEDPGRTFKPFQGGAIRYKEDHINSGLVVFLESPSS
jgi:hypothetical protein